MNRRMTLVSWKGEVVPEAKMDWDLRRKRMANARLGGLVVALLCAAFYLLLVFLIPGRFRPVDLVFGPAAIVFAYRAQSRRMMKEIDDAATRIKGEIPDGRGPIRRDGA